MDEDDDKRRRNLVAFAVLACLVCFFGIEVRALLDKVATIKTPIEPWKTLLTGLVADVYLVFRYAMRDHTKGTAFQLYWSDWDDVRSAVVGARGLLIRHHLDGRFAARVRGKNIPLRLIKDEAWGQVKPLIESQIQQARDNRGAMKMHPPVVEESMERVTVDELGLGDKAAFPIWTQLRIEYRDKDENVQFVSSLRADILSRSWTARSIQIRAVLKVLFASRLALDALLPYYLAAAAAAFMLVRFFNNTL